MKRNFILILFLLSSTLPTAQVVFQPIVQPIIVGAEDKVISIPFSINAASFTDEYEVIFDAPTENNIRLGIAYSFESNTTVIVRGSRNRDTLKIRLFTRTPGTILGSLVINGRWRNLSAGGGTFAQFPVPR